MTPEMLAYPFLFIAIFFESFVLVTLLSKPARAARARTSGTITPSVAVIVPCWNEASTVAATCDSLLSLDYPKERLEIILVDDGSTDATREAMARFSENPQVRIIYKENGGKHTALNVGIATTSAELVGCLDADSFVEPDALREIVACFDNPNVAYWTFPKFDIAGQMFELLGRKKQILINKDFSLVIIFSNLKLLSDFVFVIFFKYKINLKIFIKA